MTELMSLAKFRAELQARRNPKGAVLRFSAGDPEDVPDETRTKRFCFSDGSVDRMGDTIDPKGWDLADFTRNPVALWAHDSSAPPIGRARNVTVEGKRLMGDIEFVPPETYAFADTIFRLVDGKFINAVSVGFLPLEYSFVENDPDRGWGIDFKRQTLLEISLCPIPANPNALGDARAKGIDTRPLIEWAERALDGSDRVVLPRNELNRLRKAAKEQPMSRRQTRRRAEDDEDDKPEDKAEADCGRDPDEACGMKDPDECSVHGGKSGKSGDDDKPGDDDDDEKRLRLLLLRLLASTVKPRRRADEGDDADDDEPPLAHEDAIRLAHKSLRTSKAFLNEAVEHHNKAMDHLDGVVDALNKQDDEDKSEDEDEPEDDTDKAAQLRRAAALRRKHRPAVI